MNDDMSGFSKKNNLNPEDYYLSVDGFIIFTEKYHLKRGYCCQNACKHCPYKEKPTPNPSKGSE
ncbi:MAG: DUF5522 domain-containing protein [Bacteroidia bacterium]